MRFRLLLTAVFVLAVVGAWVDAGRVATQAASTGDAQDAFVAALRHRIHHVFVIYQENHSFDEYFGTFPGADNLSSADAKTHGYRQYDPLGKQWVTPFRITDPDIESPSHGRNSLYGKIDGGANDRYVAQEETDSQHLSAADAQAHGLLTMSYYDCDTIPYLWKYAHDFALYDHFFEGMVGPSTPGNIEIIAAQTGETQWARDPSDAIAPNGKGPGDPIVGSIDPPFGPYDGAAKTPVEIDQRYATVMLTLTGRNDSQAAQDTDGVSDDLTQIAGSGRDAIDWGWYQEGFAGEGGNAARGYVAHHNAVQFFGYLRKNDVFWTHVHDVDALLTALSAGSLPDRSVDYVKGGSDNHFGWLPANRDPQVQKNFLGDDDHPGSGDADRQIGEAFVAKFVNAIASSRYWDDSAIIITWDDPGGFYDHAVPPQFERCYDGKPCGDGPRVPLILISPYAKSGAVVSDSGDTASVVKLVETLFGLPTLASLPDERPYMPNGPRDADARLTDLTGGFDRGRIMGMAPPLPKSSALIDGIDTIPPHMDCQSLGIQPVSLEGASPSPPPGYAPR